MHRHHEEQYGFLPWFAASDDFVIMIRKQNLLAFSLAPLMGFDMAWLGFIRLEKETWVRMMQRKQNKTLFHALNLCFFF